ncbi:MAG TPA: peptidylprolyl isomerase [Thermoleophilia bacterium]
MHPLRRHSIVCLVILAVFVTVIGAALAACGDSGGPAASPVADRVVAVVNGHPVRDSDVALVRAEKRLVGKSDVAPAALNEAIDRELVRREADRLGAVADAKIVRQRVLEMSVQLGGAAALKSSLEAAGMTAAQLQHSIIERVLREATQSAAFPKLVADGKAARSYYVRHRKGAFTRVAAVHLRAIPVRTAIVAGNALKRIRQGRPFAEVARQLSIDPQSRDAGGDLGLLLLSSLPDPLRKAVMSASPGVLAKPVQAAGVWYVLDVVSRRPARVIPYAQVRARIQEELTRALRSRALEAWLVTARKDALIERP